MYGQPSGKAGINVSVGATEVWKQKEAQLAADDCSCWATGACQTADGQNRSHPDGDRSQGPFSDVAPT